MLDASSPEVLQRFQGELDLVRIIAKQVSRSLGTSVEFDDLVSGGREGLLDAARKYDPARGIPFRAYANYRVRGAMLDTARRMAALPRRAYQRLVAMEAATLVSEGEAAAAFSTQSGSRDPGEVEEKLADHMAAMATAAAMGLVAQPARSDDGEPTAEAGTRSPEDQLEEAELIALARRILSEFPRDEAEIISRYYFDGQRMDDIALELGVSRPWVSRLHTRAMSRLTKRLRSSL